MADNTFSPSIGTKVQEIERSVAAIAQGAGEDMLYALRDSLIGLAAVLERDPGIEMAADDLYAAATVVVLDSPVGARPLARKMRLMIAAMERLLARLQKEATPESEHAAPEAEAEAEQDQVPVEIVAIPWQPGFLGVLGPRVFCAPVL